jgi:hypothetical protein
MARYVVFVLALSVMVACDDKSASKPASSSTVAPLSSDDADRLPAMSVKPLAPPSYELSKLTEKDLSALLTKVGWKVTVVGKSAPDSKVARTRATAVRMEKDGNLESFTSVSCGETNPEYPAGTAYFHDDGCTLLVEARRGIRAKSDESRKLLMALLGASL